MRELPNVESMTDAELDTLHQFLSELAYKCLDEIERRQDEARIVDYYAYLSNGGRMWWGSEVYHTHVHCPALGLGGERFHFEHGWPDTGDSGDRRECKICQKMKGTKNADVC